MAGCPIRCTVCNKRVSVPQVLWVDRADGRHIVCPTCESVIRWAEEHPAEVNAAVKGGASA